MTTPISQTNLKSLKKLFSGKVRDVYEIDHERLLLVATDRLSAFDVVFGQAIPDKGRILTALSNFWFAKISSVPNHLLPIAPESVVSADERDIVAGRSVVVRRTTPLPIEAVVRGYLAGSGWAEYQKTGTVCGIHLPTGLGQASLLPTPIFTPATKAEVGAHDENINFESATKIVGRVVAEKVRDVSINIYREASIYARTRGIIIADTKFEFGLDSAGNLIWIDEALTPDSSRYWPANSYQVGISPPSFDKQFVRDYLLELGWNQSPPAPALPLHIVQALTAKYQEAYNLLT